MKEILLKVFKRKLSKIDVTNIKMIPLHFFKSELNVLTFMLQSFLHIISTLFNILFNGISHARYL